MATSIVIAGTDKSLLRVLHRAVRGHAVRTTVIYDGAQAAASMANSPPDLLILDGSVLGSDPHHLCWVLRQQPRIRTVPILMLTSGAVSEELKALHMGADRCIAKPFDVAYLQAHVASLLLRSRVEVDANPLTKLPGNLAIEAEVNRRLSARAGFWMYYVDVRHFKEFNDTYGFAAGDALIQRIARILVEAVPSPFAGFVGHIGGDDFVVISEEQVDVKQIERSFIHESREFFSRQDISRGHLFAADRDGRVREIELARLTVGRLFCPPGFCSRYEEVSQAATLMKESAKSHPVPDARRSPAAAAISAALGSFALLCPLWLASGCSAPQSRVHGGIVDRVIEQDPTRARFIEAIGIGASSADLVSDTQRKALARDAAIVKAQYELLSIVKGVNLEGGITVARALETDSNLKTSIDAAIRGAEVVKSEFTTDNGCVVTLRLPRARLEQMMGVRLQ